jgi:hypothetical protein
MVIVTVKIIRVAVLLVGWVWLVILLTGKENQTVMTVGFVMNGNLTLQNVRTVQEIGWD